MNFATERDALISLSLIIFLVGFFFMLIQLFHLTKSHYGRYSYESKFALHCFPARISWFIQELPSLAIPIYYCLFVGECAKNRTNLLVLFMFIAHYAQRCLIYPFLIRGGKRTPINYLLLAFVFCCINGYQQSSYHCFYVQYENDHLWKYSSILGIFLFVLGMTLNIHSDGILRSLRKVNETGYGIPHGGLFDYVSGANFLSEIVEWFGFALFADTSTAFSFSFFTFCIIGPRALQHHKWYKQKFEDYPQSRKALIPRIL